MAKTGSLCKSTMQTKILKGVRCELLRKEKHLVQACIFVCIIAGMFNSMDSTVLAWLGKKYHQDKEEGRVCNRSRVCGWKNSVVSNINSDRNCGGGCQSTISISTGIIERRSGRETVEGVYIESREYWEAV